MTLSLINRLSTSCRCGPGAFLFALLVAFLVALAGCAQTPPPGASQATPAPAPAVAAAAARPGAPAAARASAPPATPPELAAPTPAINNGPRLMRGMFAQRGDVGLFTDCTSGQRLAVLPEAEYFTLERAYGMSRAFGDALMATVEGNVVARPSSAGAAAASVAVADAGSGQMLVVQRFVSLTSETACPALRAAIPLESTYWKLEKVRGKTVEVHRQQPEPHLVLQSARKRVSGASGCNPLVGAYVLGGNRLKFESPAAPGKACRQGADQERSLLAALKQVATWRVADRQLMLADAQGSTLAQFSAKVAARPAAAPVAKPAAKPAAKSSR